MGNRASSERAPDSTVPGTSGSGEVEETPTDSSTSQTPNVNNAAALAKAAVCTAVAHHQDDFKYTPRISGEDGVDPTAYTSTLRGSSPRLSTSEGGGMEVDRRDSTSEQERSRSDVNLPIPKRASSLQMQASISENEVQTEDSEEIFSSNPAKKMRIDGEEEEEEEEGSRGTGKNDSSCGLEKDSHENTSDILTMSLEDCTGSTKHTTSSRTTATGKSQMAMEDIDQEMSDHQTEGEEDRHEQRMEQDEEDYFEKQMWQEEEEKEEVGGGDQPVEMEEQDYYEKIAEHEKVDDFETDEDREVRETFELQEDQKLSERHGAKDRLEEVEEKNTSGQCQEDAQQNSEQSPGTEKHTTHEEDKQQERHLSQEDPAMYEQHGAESIEQNQLDKDQQNKNLMRSEADDGRLSIAQHGEATWTDTAAESAEDAGMEMPQRDWSALPDSILLWLYRLASDSDRCNMAAVCRPWRKMLYEPSLWRTRKLWVQGSSLLFLQSLGEHVHHVTLAFPLRWSRTTLQHLLELLQDFQLETFTLRDFGRALEIKCHGKTEMVSWLAEFIQSQSTLRGLTLSNASLNFSSGRQICQAVPRSLVDLDVRGLFQESGDNVPAYSVFAFWRWLKPHRNLRRLSLTYDYMSGESMESLAAHSLGRTLERLEITVTKLTPRRHKYPASLWRRWTARNPKLQVDLSLEDCPIAFVKSLVGAKIPLRALRLTLSADNGMPDDEDSLNLTLNHVAETCPDLERIDVKDKELLGPSVESGLAHVLRSCKQLRCLEVNGPVSLTFVKSLYQMQTSGGSGLRQARVTVQALEETEVLALRAVVSRCQAQLPPGIAMTVEAGSAIIPSI